MNRRGFFTTLAKAAAVAITARSIPVPVPAMNVDRLDGLHSFRPCYRPSDPIDFFCDSETAGKLMKAFEAYQYEFGPLRETVAPACGRFDPPAIRDAVGGIYHD